MTLDDAVDLVVKVLKESRGSETYVFKTPFYKITDITEAVNYDGKINVVRIREWENSIKL